MWIFSRSSYQPVDQQTDPATHSLTEDASPDPDNGGTKDNPVSVIRTQRRWLTGLSVMNMILIVLIVYFVPRHGQATWGSYGISSSSPLMDLAIAKPQHKVMNGAFRDNSSIWRMDPSPEVDAAWNRVSGEQLQLIPVTTEDLVRAGKNPATSVRAPLSWGLGHDAYIAQVEVFHQIHCLNELRKELHPEYYFQSRAKRTELRTSHISHCLHMLLQQLMCTADVGIIGHYWLQDKDYSDPKTRPFPDFSLEKTCRDFDSVLEWLQTEGGIKNLSEKLPMEPPEDVSFTIGRGYSNAEV